MKDIFLAVIMAAVPVLTAYGIGLMRELAANAEASASSTESKDIINEVTCWRPFWSVPLRSFYHADGTEF